MHTHKEPCKLFKGIYASQTHCRIRYKRPYRCNQSYVSESISGCVVYLGCFVARETGRTTYQMPQRGKSSVKADSLRVRMLLNYGLGRLVD